MRSDDIYRQVLKMLLFTVAAMVLMRVTRGLILPIFILIGVAMVIQNKLGWALVYFVLFPFFVCLNPAIVPKTSSIVGPCLRLGPLLIGLTLAATSASRQGRHRLPFIMIVPFMFAAVVSSADGWAPMVSFLKIINFSFFLFGIWFGTQNLQKRPQDLMILRSFFLALAAIIILGSLLLYPFPSISFATSLQHALQEGGEDLAEEVFRQQQLEGARMLFCGITNQSQMLGPVGASCFALVMCDMLFIERRFRWPHMAVAIFAPVVLFLTRSRLALLTLMFSFTVILFYSTAKIKISRKDRGRLMAGALTFMALMVVAAVVSEISSGTMTQWLRKTNDVSSDQRTMGEALTSSRQGLIEQSMYEFRRNPLFGSGFQVAEYTKSQTRGKTFVFAASIEKGVLPVMVLGETGLLGEALFLAFLGSFFLVCSQRRYYVTITMFSVFLVSNMGEATFFSPGGGGGFLWMLCVVGGFSMDTILLFRRNLDEYMRNVALANVESEEPPPPQMLGAY